MSIQTESDWSCEISCSPPIRSCLPLPSITRHASKKAHSSLRQNHNESVTSKSPTFSQGNVSSLAPSIEGPFTTPENTVNPPLAPLHRRRNESVASKSSSLLLKGRELEDPFEIPHNSPKLPRSSFIRHRNESVASKSSSLLLTGRDLEDPFTTRTHTPELPLPVTTHRCNESAASKPSANQGNIKQEPLHRACQGNVISYTPPSASLPHGRKLENPISKAESGKTISRHRSDSGLGSTDNDSQLIEQMGRSQRKLLVEKSELEGVIQMLQAQIDQMKRAASESNITLDRVTKERSAAVIELSAAYTNISQLISENESLEQKNRMLKCSVDALCIPTPSEISNLHNKFKVHSKPPGPVSKETPQPTRRENPNIPNELKVPSKLVPAVIRAESSTHSEYSNLHNNSKVHSKPGPILNRTSQPRCESSNILNESKVHSKPGSVARHASQSALYQKDLILRKELKVRSELVPVVEITTEPAPDDEPTLRPSQSPALALASVIKGLEDELSREKRQFAKHQDLYNNLDPSLGRRARKSLKEKMEILLKTIDSKADYIYSLYDVVEGEMAD